MSTYPVMLIDYHADIGADGAWSYTGDEPPAQGDEIVITHSSGLPGGDSMSVRVKWVDDHPPFAITATMLW
jgi:hypothetical protein